MQILVDQFSRNLRSAMGAISFAGLTPDHLCYRVATREEYEIKKRELLLENELLTEAEIRGRPIATFRLVKPLRFDGHEIELLELPAPKVGQTFITGFEHVEYVLREPFKTYLDAHPELRPLAEIRENPFNPEMTFTFGDYGVKLHYAPLDEVIALEVRPHIEQKIFVFDLDGTLIDSMAEIALVNREVVEELGIEPPPGTQFGSTFQKIIDQFSITQINAVEYARRWSQRMIGREVKLLPGMRELLDSVRELNIPMVVWTARDRASTDSAIDRIGIRSYFSAIRTFEDACPKPSVDGLKYLIGGRPKEFVYYIGDSDADEVAARDFGCRFFRETTPPTEILRALQEV